ERARAANPGVEPSGLYDLGDQCSTRPGRTFGSPSARACPQAARASPERGLTCRGTLPMDNCTTLLGSARDEFEDVIQRFENAWQSRTRPEINAYLQSNSGGVQLLIELVHVDLEYRLRAGESARVEEYLGRYPDLSDDKTVMLELIAAEYEFR